VCYICPYSRSAVCEQPAVTAVVVQLKILAVAGTHQLLGSWSVVVPIHRVYNVQIVHGPEVI